MEGGRGGGAEGKNTHPFGKAERPNSFCPSVVLAGNGVEEESSLIKQG